jgi:hypothetical protein
VSAQPDWARLFRIALPRPGTLFRAGELRERGETADPPFETGPFPNRR